MKFVTDFLWLSLIVLLLNSVWFCFAFVKLPKPRKGPRTLAFLFALLALSPVAVANYRSAPALPPTQGRLEYRQLMFRPWLGKVVYVPPGPVFVPAVYVPVVPVVPFYPYGAGVR